MARSSTFPTYYHARAPIGPCHPPLEGAVEAEVGIVGGGLAGLATALSLAERGRDVVLLEAETIGAGASGRNGGLVSAGFALATETLERAVDLPAARELVALGREAVTLIRHRIERYRIACDLVPGIVVASWFDDPAGLQAEVARLNARYEQRLVFWSRERLRAAYPSPCYWDGIFDPDGFHLDPLALCRGYAVAAADRGARLFEGTPGLALARAGGRWRVATLHGSLLAERLILAQNVRSPTLLPALVRAVLPIVTYIIVTAPLTGRHAGIIRAPHAVYDTRFATGYYRLLPDRRLLWGGRISTREHPRDLAGLMRRDLARVYPDLADVRIDHAWSGRMGFARHKMPLVRELQPGLWVSTAFGGHGLNTTTMAGELVAAAIAQGDERYRLLEPFDLRWVGGRLGPLAAQAIYWRHGLVEALRAAWQRRHAARPFDRSPS